MREFEKIKREREDEQKRKEIERQNEILKKKQEEMLEGNDLMNSGSAGGSSYSLKRRWHEESVFKNQSKTIRLSERKRFINDTVRSDFHKKFLNKYIQ
jgi:protein CWC15